MGRLYFSVPCPLNNIFSFGVPYPTNAPIGMIFGVHESMFNSFTLNFNLCSAMCSPYGRKPQNHPE